ncbi:hypothetical protein P9112_002326 [Eukaryota sp. TZLM1-RC]
MSFPHPVLRYVLHQVNTLDVSFFSLNEAGLISDGAAEFLTMLSEVSPHEQTEMVLSDFNQTLNIFIEALALSSPAPLVRVLTFMYHLLHRDETLHIFSSSESISTLVDLFLTIAQSKIPLPKSLALINAATIFRSLHKPANDPQLTTLISLLNSAFDNITSTTDKQNHSSDDLLMLPDVLFAEALLRALAELMRCVDIRRSIVNQVVPRLRLLFQKFNSSTQIVYCCLVSLWLLSFDYDNYNVFLNHGVFQIISNLITVQASDFREPLIRLCLCILNNALSHEIDDVSLTILDLNLASLARRFIERKWKDTDIKAESTRFLSNIEHLQRQYSSWDVYVKEIHNFRFKWSPPHQSDIFWSQNIAKFERDGFLLVRMLLSYLDCYGKVLYGSLPSDTCISFEQQGRTVQVDVDRGSFNRDSVSVVLNDLQRFISQHPVGKQIVNKLNGKEIVSRLLIDSDSSISRDALICVQTLLITFK